MSEDAAQYNIHEAKTSLSRIIERVEHGEEIVISRAGHPRKAEGAGRPARTNP